MGSWALGHHHEEKLRDEAAHLSAHSHVCSFPPLNSLSLQKVRMCWFNAVFCHTSQGGLYIDLLDLVLCCYSAAVETPAYKPEFQCDPPINFSYREALGDLTALTSDSDSESDSDTSEDK